MLSAKIASIFLVITSFIKTKFKTLNHLYHPDFEVLWAHIRPKRLPRGIPCIVSGTVYHPPSGDDNSMIDYVSLTLTYIEGCFSGWGIFLTGDFNRLNTNRLKAQFRMKQLARVPTRGDQILDLILTNRPICVIKIRSKGVLPSDYLTIT